ncbi:MAG: N-acetylglucosamine-6-phosphate deacetylase [Gemmatimonadota bacterium]
MPGLLFTAPRVIPAAGGVAGRDAAVLEPGYLVADGGRITAVGAGPPPPDAGRGRERIELAAGTLVPGFVDLQVNGYYGTDFGDTDADGWAAVASRLPETGTTAFLPTFVTAPLPRLAAALRSAGKIIPRIERGARMLGVHLEGPFLSPARRGAHNPAWLTAPAPAAVGELLAAGSGVLRLVTLAPELDGGLAAVRQLAAAGTVVSVGHSDATAAQVAAAADAGARMVTHLYNAQRPLHHREPGVVGQALADPRLTSGLIADLVHVAAQACLIAFAAAPGRICLVTDAAACAGLPPGDYLLGGEPIRLPPGAAAPVRPDGMLAGSALRMDRAVANLVSAGAGLAAAVAAATRVPADLIGEPGLGRLAPGARADLAWLDGDLRTRGTWVAGEQVYRA